MKKLNSFILNYRSVREEVGVGGGGGGGVGGNWDPKKWSRENMSLT